MHDILRERLWRNLEALPDERIYQVLDYIEFLNSKYAREGVPPSSGLQRFGEKLEDRMRMQGVGMSAIRGTLSMMGAADRVVNDLAEAGRTLIREVEVGLKTPAERAPEIGERVLGPAPAEE
jgi:hypothetical protein